MKSNPLVSIIIPTRNSEALLDNCLKSIQGQSYKEIEVIIVDSDSKDNTLRVAKRNKVKIYKYNPKVKKNTFDAPHKRNYGVEKAKGEFVYYVDSDMVLLPNVVREAVRLCSNKCDALIIPEDSYGEGIWANAKNLERRCYWGDKSVEAPRFFKKLVWEKLGGLDEKLGGGGDDWDLHQKLIENKYRVGRTQEIVLHNEGNLKLKKLLKKRFMYGRDSLKYIAKRPKAGIASYFPVKMSYIRNWKLFISRPKDTFFFIIMRTFEYVAGALGILYYIFKK